MNDELKRQLKLIREGHLPGPSENDTKTVSKAAYNELKILLNTDEFKLFAKQKSIKLQDSSILDEDLSEVEDGYRYTISIGFWNALRFNLKAKGNDEILKPFFNALKSLKDKLNSKLTDRRFIINTDNEGESHFGTISVDYKY